MTAIESTSVPTNGTAVQNVASSTDLTSTSPGSALSAVATSAGNSTVTARAFGRRQVLTSADPVTAIETSSIDTASVAEAVATSIVSSAENVAETYVAAPSLTKRADVTSITTSSIQDTVTSSPANPSTIVNAAGTPPSSSAISPPPPPPPVKNVESSPSDSAQNITTTGIAQDVVSSATVTPLTETSSIVKAAAQTLTSSTLPSSVPPAKRDAIESILSSSPAVTNAVTSFALVTTS